jgi:hypothetical protein
MEATFEEARQRRGFETQRQCSEKKAIRRTAPALLGLFSLVALFAHQRKQRRVAGNVRRSAWYEKPHPTISDALALVGGQLWAQSNF